MSWLRSLSNVALAGLVAGIWIAGNLVYIVAMHVMCGC